MDVFETRKHMGLTRSQLAALLGVDVMTVLRWERGVRNASCPVRLALEVLYRERTQTAVNNRWPRALADSTRAAATKERSE